MRKIRQFSILDKAIACLDHSLRAVLLDDTQEATTYPARNVDCPPLSEEDRLKSMCLMRVNHAGEVSAQGLYLGQSLLSRDTETFFSLMEAANEEKEHLHWCEIRLQELDGRVSMLSGVWFLGSLFIGMWTACAGDDWSLGFVEETENQVVEHLNKHLFELPQKDISSRAILLEMRSDEARHAKNASLRGGRKLPHRVREIMQFHSKIMTTVAFRI